RPPKTTTPASTPVPATMPIGLADAIANQLAALAPQGPTTPVDVKRSDANWSDFRLEDGSIIRIKPTVLNVQYEPGRYNDRGEPVYHFNVTFAVGVIAPKRLLQGYGKKKPAAKK